MDITNEIVLMIDRGLPEAEREIVRGVLADLKEAVLAGQNPLRIAGAVIEMRRRGRQVDQIMRQVNRDWRDLLIKSGLGNQDWRAVLERRYGD